MRSWVILIVVFILGVLAALYFLASGYFGPGIQDIRVDEPAPSEDVSDSDQNNIGQGNIDVSDSGSSGISSGSSGGGSGGGGSGGGSSASGSSETQSGESESCNTIRLSYSISNFVKNVVCHEEQLGTCVNKGAICSVLVRNLDDSGNGEFTLEMEFFETSNDVLFSETITNFLFSQNEASFESVFNVTGSDADKDITCFYDVIEVPQIEKCS